MKDPKSFEKAAFFGVVLGTGMLTTYVLGKAWEKSTSRPPPKNPAAPEVTWGEALMWSAIAGVAVGMTRTVTRRLLSEVLEDHATPTGMPDD